MKQRYDEFTQVDNMPDRIAHRRKIAERIALDQTPPINNDATKPVDAPNRGYSLLSGLPYHGCYRGPNG